ncbi:MAG: helix-turn-helix transcriptional regulator [Vallitalea sp.]|nr:helix-turn-helix transcriptional regulator [Vallitalea sp.]
MVEKTTFANRLKSIRKDKSLTLDELSKIVNLPAQTLNRYELGQRIPKIDVVKKIASNLDIDPLWLIGYGNSTQDSYFLLEKQLSNLGYEIIYELENGYMILRGPEGEFELEQNDDKFLKESTETYLKFKLQELMSKRRKI